MNMSIISKKFSSVLFTLACLLGLAGVAFGAAAPNEQMWRVVDLRAMDPAAQRLIVPSIYRTVQLDVAALQQALSALVDGGAIDRLPLNQSVAAISVGMVEGRALCDLDYAEDSTAEVDANVVMTGDGGLVEVQATAERTPLSRASLDELLALAEGGIAALRTDQESALGALPA